ncbi:DUF6054 family protein [Anaerosphaera multitolerans]|uniref:Uncharacterized protein n=1 Tax=Anaerosphaera multitolerans TaxID=2487351 RepID=A0A437S4R9_9FIRM|nr:DUF6054 family protein [Anaerosphaera multitolerans]RVU53978.1 hypothetical protein EF514_09690 [Anaerosphaera multitolerans]
MTKYEKKLKGDFEEILEFCHNTVMNKSMPSSFEGGSDYSVYGVRIAVRVYERYSAFGGNRVSLNLTLIGSGEDLFLSAIASGGSQALIWKVNTYSEESFLSTLVESLKKYT